MKSLKSKLSEVKIGAVSLLSVATQEKLLALAERLELDPGNQELETILCALLREAIAGLTPSVQKEATRQIRARDGGYLHIPTGRRVRVLHSPVDGHANGPGTGTVGEVLRHDAASGMLLVRYPRATSMNAPGDGPEEYDWYSLQGRVEEV